VALIVFLSHLLLCVLTDYFNPARTDASCPEHDQAEAVRAASRTVRMNIVSWACLKGLTQSRCLSGSLYLNTTATLAMFHILHSIDKPVSVVSDVAVAGITWWVTRCVSCCDTRGCAALDGLPKVGEDKYDKLLGVLKKRFEPHGEIREGCFWMPRGEDGLTKGYAFIEYSKREVSC
jgi:hypothetical protein